MSEFIVERGLWFGASAILVAIIFIVGFAIYLHRKGFSREQAISSWASFAQLLTVFLAFVVGLSSFWVYIEDRNLERANTQAALEEQKIQRRDQATLEIARKMANLRLVDLRITERELAHAQQILPPLLTAANRLARMDEISGLSDEAQWTGALGRQRLEVPVMEAYKEFQVIVLAGPAFVPDIVVTNAIKDFQAKVGTLLTTAKDDGVSMSSIELSAAVTSYFSSVQTRADAIRKELAAMDGFAGEFDNAL